MHCRYHNQGMFSTRDTTAFLKDATLMHLALLMMTGAKDENGVYTNTEDIDCEVCKGDLHLWAVVSMSCPERATCPEHVNALGCPIEDMTLLHRFSL